MKISMLGFLLLVGLSFFVQAEAQEDSFPNLKFVYRDPMPVRHFDPETDPNFSDPELALKMRVIYEEEIQRVNYRTNHFCLIGYEWQDGRRDVPVFWQELGEIVWWRGRNGQGANSEGGINSLSLYSRHTNVERDTVTTEADLQGSTYLTVRSGVVAVIRDCALRGRWYAIEPFEIPPVCESASECEEPDINPLSQRVR